MWVGFRVGFRVEFVLGWLWVHLGLGWGYWVDLDSGWI